MKLISSSETIAFLASAAPKPWIKRMLLWMIYDGELAAYFTAGTIKITGHVYEPLHFLPGDTVDKLPKQNGHIFAKKSPQLEQALRDSFGEDAVKKIIGKNGMDLIDDDPIIWSKEDDPHHVSAGFFVWASEIDWDNGSLKTDFLPEGSNKDEYLFWDAAEHLHSNLFDHPAYSVFLSGLCFELGKIEMLLPTAEAAPNSAMIIVRGDQGRQTGRPRKWDWDSALYYIVSLANKPDGLPDGPGAQARIEELLAQWFIDHHGDAPATSQIRARAQKIVHRMV